jgi:hypothetical protein
MLRLCATRIWPNVLRDVRLCATRLRDVRLCATRLWPNVLRDVRLCSTRPRLRDVRQWPNVYAQSGNGA